ncbi:MAG: hypothetical protein ABIL89_07955 [candidate division WOR-3 bacterium]|jgi:CHASE3 domain sensor protein
MIGKILKFLFSLLPTAMEYINSKQENQKMDNILEFVKGIENRLDKIYVDISNQLKTLLVWLKLIFITQIIIFLLVLILLFKR